MKTINDLTPEELKLYKDFIYLLHFKNFLDLYGIDTIRTLSLEVFHSSCFRTEKELSEVPDYAKSLYYIARDIKKNLESTEPLPDEALKFIQANREPDKYSITKMYEYLSNLN